MLSRRTAKPREGDAGDASRNCEDEAFGEHLPDDAGTVGAERESNGKLALTAAGAGEQQVGEIDARDEEDQSGGAAQHEQRRAQLAGEVLLQGSGGDDEVPAESSGEDVIFGAEKVGEAIEVCLYFGWRTTPGLRRARMETVRMRLVGEIGFCEDSSSSRGIQNCVPCGKSKPCGMTPTMVRGRRSMAMVLPTMWGSAPKRLRQKS